MRLACAEKERRSDVFDFNGRCASFCWGRTLSKHRLSKSRFVAGLQCHKLLWWRVHESEAPELQPDKILEDLFSQGRHVGRVATEHFPNGHLVDLPYHDYDARVAATKDAMADGACAVL